MILGLEKRILWRLLVLALITTPLFGLLGGVPVLNFSWSEFRFFLRFIALISLLTVICWAVNILLLTAAGKLLYLKNIFIRSVISIAACIALSATILTVFHRAYPPQPKVVFGNGGAVLHRAFSAEVKTPDISMPPDSVLKFMPVPSAGSIRTAGSFFPFPLLMHALTINVIILILCELVMMHFRQQKIENENALLRQSNVEAKNIQLKNQLQPHFLFNSLNTLRLLLKKDAGKAESYLLQLSDILRVSTTSAVNSVTSVKDELDMCLAYLQMQQVRFGDMLLFDITNNQLLQANGQLPVFALQQLAENAIKHNAFTVQQPLHIFIDYDTGRQLITVRNRIRLKKMNGVTTQTGLKNLNERYRLLASQDIRVNNSGEEFAVSIKIL